MGYYARDGAYVHDDDDINAKEAMISSRGKSDGFFIKKEPPKKTWLEKHDEELRRELEEARERERINNSFYGRRYEEMEKEEERKRIAQERKYAFLQAKVRFNKLSAFSRLKLVITKKDPKHIDTKSMTQGQIEQLYRGKSR